MPMSTGGVLRAEDVPANSFFGGRLQPARNLHPGAAHFPLGGLRDTPERPFARISIGVGANERTAYVTGLPRRHMQPFVAVTRVRGWDSILHAQSLPLPVLHGTEPPPKQNYTLDARWATSPARVQRGMSALHSPRPDFRPPRGEGSSIMARCHASSILPMTSPSASRASTSVAHAWSTPRRINPLAGTFQAEDVHWMASLRRPMSAR